MKKLILLLLTVALVSGNPSPSPTPAPITETPNNSGNTTTTTTTTASPPTTTKPPAPPVPPAPNTTTTTTTTTTPATTTTVTQPTTTTSSSTTPSSTTTAGPSPAVGKWTVQDNGTVCVVLQLNAKINVTVGDAKNKTSKTITLPTSKEAVATGVCGKLDQNITINWPSVNSTTNNVSLHFVKSETEGRYSLHHLEVTVSDINSTNPLVLIHDQWEFSTALENSYRCLMQQNLPLKDAAKNETRGSILISNLQFQAFKKDNSSVFGLAKDCTFDTPDIVPIVVGCVLAGLVILVLIAYLVGRRRNQPLGYVSM